MSIRAWNHPVALGLAKLVTPSVIALLIVASCWIWDSTAARQHRAEQEAREQFERAYRSIEQTCLDLSGPRAEACEREVIDASRDYERSEYDLAAQQDMAQYALVGLFIAMSGVLITSVATFFVYWTLRATLAAVGEAEKATTAARDALTITKEIGDRQLRPYLTYEGSKIAPLVSGSYRMFEIDVSFRNCGLTPGIITAGSSALYVAGGKSGWEPRKNSWRHIRVVIGPNQTEKIRFDGLFADPKGSFPPFCIGVLIWYEALGRAGAADVFEDHFWLHLDGTGLRQDFPNAGLSLYRPEQDSRNEA